MSRNQLRELAAEAALLRLTTVEENTKCFTREQELNLREQELNLREQKCTEREKELNQRKKELNKKEKELNVHKETLIQVALLQIKTKDQVAKVKQLHVNGTECIKPEVDKLIELKSQLSALNAQLPTYLRLEIK